MKFRISFFLRLVIFWILFFVIAKLIFLFFFHEYSFKQISAWPGIFYHGFKLDLSAISYLMILPTLLIAVSGLIKGQWYLFIIKWYSYVLFVFLSLIIIIDLVIYNEWGFRLDATPLIYLKNFRDVFTSTPIWQITLMILSTAVLTIVPVYFYNKFLKTKNDSYKNVWYTFPVFILIAGSLIIPIRGGFGTAPINTGSVFFHKEPFVNHAALNLPWNIMYSLTKSKDMVNPYAFFSTANTNNFIKKYKESGVTNEYIIKNKRPNVILVLLESYTANVVGCLNETFKATPNLDSLANNGLLFTNFYASGVRSDKGLTAVLSSYPSIPNTSVMIFPEKTQQIPGLAKSFNEHGYSTTFYYGGDINFASMKSYIVNCGFQKIISQDDFTTAQKSMSWGVADELLFQKAYGDILQADTPYFKTIFTLASHSPYDIPGKPWKQGNDRITLFLNSVHYTDSCLGVFIHQLEEKNLLKNTLVVLVADHGNQFPGDLPYSSIEKFRIPMVWYGDVLEKKGQVAKIASQTDIASTLLNQLSINSDAYLFSKDIFGSNFKSEALYAYNNGFGYVNDSVNFSYFHSSKQVEDISGNTDEESINYAKLFYQSMYDNFLSLK